MVSGADSDIVFKHCHFYGAPIVVYNQARAVFEDCAFQHAQHAALSCYTAAVEIKCCRIATCSHGIVVGARGAAVCADTTIQDCALSGVLASSGAQLKLANVDISSCECGVHVLQEGTTAALTSCSISQARDAGLRVHAAIVTGVDTTMQGCKGTGLVAEGGAQLSGRAYTITNCEAGVQAQHAGTLVELHSSMVSASCKCGIFVEQGAKGRLFDVRVVNSGTNGLAVHSAGSAVRANRSTFDRSGHSGASLKISVPSTNAPELVALTCNFRRNALNGLHLVGSRLPLVARDCHFDNNRMSGLRSHGELAPDAEMVDNTFKGNHFAPMKVEAE